MVPGETASTIAWRGFGDNPTWTNQSIELLLVVNGHTEILRLEGAPRPGVRGHPIVRTDKEAVAWGESGDLLDEPGSIQPVINSFLG